VCINIIYILQCIYLPEISGRDWCAVKSSTTVSAIGDLCTELATWARMMIIHINAHKPEQINYSKRIWYSTWVGTYYFYVPTFLFILFLCTGAGTQPISRRTSSNRYCGSRYCTDATGDGCRSWYRVGDYPDRAFDGLSWTRKYKKQHWRSFYQFYDSRLEM